MAFKSLIFLASVTLKFVRWPWKENQGTFFILHQDLCIISKPSVNSNWRYSLETLNSGKNWWFIIPCDLEIWYMTFRINRAPFLYEVLCIISNPWVKSNWSYSLETLNLGQNWQFFILCDLEIRWMTLENYRAILLYEVKLYALFQSHGLIQTWVTVGDFYTPCTTKL